MKKNMVRLTESQLHKVIRESVKSILINEGFFDFFRKKQPSQEQQVSTPPRQRSAKEIELRKVRGEIYPRFKQVHNYKSVRGLADRQIGRTGNVYQFILELQTYLKGYVESAIDVEDFPENKGYQNDLIRNKEKLSQLIAMFESSSGVFNNILANIKESNPKEYESFVEEYGYYKGLVQYCKGILSKYN